MNNDEIFHENPKNFNDCRCQELSDARVIDNDDKLDACVAKKRRGLTLSEAARLGHFIRKCQIHRRSQKAIDGLKRYLETEVTEWK